ncbi:hypothetical protein TSAR_014320, partial [Trichomalopsis sarcophagae]
ALYHLICGTQTLSHFLKHWLNATPWLRTTSSPSRHSLTLHIKLASSHLALITSHSIPLHTPSHTHLLF